MPRKKKVTLATLAQHLGLSVYTVSKALRGLPGMSEETRLEVVKAAREYGYLTKEQEFSMLQERIPSLSMNQRRFLFIMPSSITGSPYIYVLLQELQDRMGEMGHKVDLIIIPSSLKPERFDRWVEEERIAFADGLFISMYMPEELESLLLRLKQPRILLNFPPPHAALVDSVIWDVYEATRQSVHYLFANGHRKISFLGDRTGARGYKMRWQAFRTTMEELGEVIQEEQHILRTLENKDQLIEIFKEHMERVKPTALLCSTIIDIPWVLYACSTCGYTIPDDVSIVHLDHMKSNFDSQISHPKLLFKETGYRAAEKMLWRIANPHLPYEHVRLQGGFFHGNTVKNLNTAPAAGAAGGGVQQG